MMRIGLVGLGRQGFEHLAALQALQEQDELEVAAVCDIRPSDVQAQKNFDSIPFFSSFDALLDEPELDAIIVAVPNDLHVDFCRRALQSGLHVLKEKPFALTQAEAEFLHAEAVTCNAVLQVAQQRGYHPLFTQLRSLLPELGRISIFDYSFTLNDTRASWYSERARGGGAWAGLGWHGCWLMASLLGAPEEMSLQLHPGREETQPSDSDRIANFRGIYADGCVARLLVSVTYPSKQEQLVIGGTRGTAIWNRAGLTHYDERGQVIQEWSAGDDWPACYQGQLLDFIHRIKAARYGSHPIDRLTAAIYHGARAHGEYVGAHLSVAA